MIKSNTLVEDFDVISQYDDSLDKDAPDFEQKWKEYRDGMGEPPLKAGEQPTRFKLRHITSTEHTYLSELAYGGDKGLFIGAAALALVSVKGMVGPDGHPVAVVQEVTKVGPLRLRSADKATLDKFPLEVLLELGAIAMERSTVRPSS